MWIGPNPPREAFASRCHPERSLCRSPPSLTQRSFCRSLSSRTQRSLCLSLSSRASEATRDLSSLPRCWATLEIQAPRAFSGAGARPFEIARVGSLTFASEIDHGTRDGHASSARRKPRPWKPQGRAPENLRPRHLAARGGPSSSRPCLSNSGRSVAGSGMVPGGTSTLNSSKKISMPPGTTVTIARAGVLPIF